MAGSPRRASARVSLQNLNFYKAVSHLNLTLGVDGTFQYIIAQKRLIRSLCRPNQIQESLLPVGVDVGCVSNERGRKVSYVSVGAVRPEVGDLLRVHGIRGWL